MLEQIAVFEHTLIWEQIQVKRDPEIKRQGFPQERVGVLIGVPSSKVDGHP